jgi:hypothetical protein
MVGELAERQSVGPFHRPTRRQRGTGRAAGRLRAPPPRAAGART